LYPKLRRLDIDARNRKANLAGFAPRPGCRDLGLAVAADD
jgi:hypothetical protein